MKTCSKCLINKELDKFSKAKYGKYGVASTCKACEKLYRDAHKEHRAEYQKEYRKENSQELSDKKKIYQQVNKKKLAAAKKLYVKNNTEKVAKQQRSKYLRNKDKIDAYKKKYYYEHHDHILKDRKKYRIENADKIKEADKLRWKKPNALIGQRINRHNRRVVKNASKDGSINTKSLKALMKKQNYKCAYCECPLDLTIKYSVHLDHVIPLSRGGAHTIQNVVWSCAFCNLSKGDKVA